MYLVFKIIMLKVLLATYAEPPREIREPGEYNSIGALLFSDKPRVMHSMLMLGDLGACLPGKF